MRVGRPVQNTPNALQTTAAPPSPATDKTPTPSSPTRSLSITHRLLTAAMLTCFALGGWFFALNGTSAAAVSVETARNSVSSTTPELQTQSIEQIRLGQRVSGRNPLREETQKPSRTIRRPGEPCV